MKDEMIEDQTLHDGETDEIINKFNSELAKRLKKYPDQSKAPWYRIVRDSLFSTFRG
jgi:hypothetical protein